jgi:hypothetical protein
MAGRIAARMAECGVLRVDGVPVGPPAVSQDIQIICVMHHPGR